MDQQCHERGAALFEELRRALEHRRAIVDAAGRPLARMGGGALQCCSQLLRRGEVAVPTRRARFREYVLLQPFEGVRSPEVETLRVALLRTIQSCRKRYSGMTQAVERAQLDEGIGDHLVERDALVHEAIHERGVGAILEQPPDKIGEQIRVWTDRRIDTHARELG